jgi:alkylation response protein AidB-like acyl-CoA dehydrogenase
MRRTAEQEALRASVRTLLDHAGAARPPAAPDPDAEARLWQRLCREIGVAGLAIPDRYGGSGAGAVEIHVVLEELGRSLTPSPMLGSAVLATTALLCSGDEAACERLLPGLAAGYEIAALAWTTQAGRFDPAEVACRAAPAGGPDPDWAVSGEAHYVIDGAAATVLLVPATMPDGGIGLFDVHPAQPAVTRISCPTVDQTRRLAVIRLHGAPGRKVGDRARLDRARDAACIALSAEQVGAAARALAITADYTKVRVQFGRPIASFQALQHRMADLLVRVEAARSLSYAAAEALQHDAPDAGLRAAAAKAYCSESFQQVAAEMIQLHGAIGMTWEHDAHRYFKRAHGAAMLLGTSASHVARVAAAVLDG